MNWREFFLTKHDARKDLFLLLTISTLYGVGIALSNTFVNIFIWKQSNSYIEIGIYNLIIVIFQPLTFFLAGFLTKKWNRVLVLRVGIFVLAVFYLIILIFKEEASSHLFLLGALLGTGYGFYWLAFNILTFEITEPETRKVFNSVQGALLSLVGMLAPLCSGFVITRMPNLHGYYIVFGISLVMFLLGVIVSFFISHREMEGRYEIKEAFGETKRNANWKSLLQAHFFQGIREGSFFFLISVLVFVSTNNELALGTFSLINSAISFICFSFATRFLNEKHSMRYIFIGGTLLYLSVLLLIFKITYINLLIYAGVISIGYSLVQVPYVTLTFDVMGKANNARNFRVEYVVIREIFLNLGRIVSIILFLLFMKFGEEPWNLKILLLIVGSGYFVMYFFVRKIRL